MVILSYQLPLTDAERLLDEVLGYVYLPSTTLQM